MVVLKALYSFPGWVSQVLATMSGVLSAIPDGMQYGWTSPISSILLSTSSPIAVTDNDIFILEVAYVLGGILGIPITMYLLDKVGRKNTILFAAFVALFAWILIGFSSSVITLHIARCILGSTADVNFVTGPVYIAEISDKNIRGCLESTTQILLMLGVVVIYCIGPYVSIAVSSIIGASILITQLSTFFFMPDSPYYHLMKNQKEEARKSLQAFRSTSDVDDELQIIEEAIIKENLETSRFLDLFKVRSNLKVVLILSVLNMLQHFSGVSVMAMNMHMILKEADSMISANAGAIIYSLIMLIACVVAGMVVDHAGRRLLLCVSSILTALTLVILAVYFTVKHNGVNLTSYNWIPVLMIMLYALTVKLGLGTVPCILIGELFPTNVKVWGVAYISAVVLFAVLLSVLFFNLLQEHFVAIKSIENFQVSRLIHWFSVLPDFASIRSVIIVMVLSI
ncbi:hypothetical protein RN001_012905 [Aquatica leii]|uniref:Major facilitator superfamily (MFS) profile domain-containing protein n=1 Tax=Aquatica leii TaxID=1421715 RepID=A0AAN7QFM2_9COLE|nr:hypothetical protein RN001_012905 [Aquatica leii]